MNITETTGLLRWQVLLFYSVYGCGHGVYPEGSDAPGKLPVYRWWRFGPLVVRRYPTTREVRLAMRKRAELRSRG